MQIHLIIAVWLIVGFLVARKVFALSTRIVQPEVKADLFILAMVFWPMFMFPGVVAWYREKIKRG